MEGFKPVVKMKCGGSVSKAVEKQMKTGGKVMHEDVKEDKKMVKKAINLHDDQLHEGKKTDLSKLKTGGRCKKDGGTVRKYKSGGEVKKMAMGGLTDPATQAVVNADVLRRRRAGMGAPGGIAAPNAVPPAAAPSAPVGQPQAPNINAQPPGPVMKKGGKVKKGCK
jgi:hypothetical protein